MKLKFLKSSNFWSVFIAGIALVFSLMPPLSQWVKTDSLSLLYSNRTLINNYFGILSYGLLIDLRNTGNTNLSITKMELIIKSDNGNEKKYLAETINQYKGGTQAVVTPMTRIVIKPDEQWKNILFFYLPIDPELELIINELKFKFADDLNEQQRGPNPQTLKSAPYSLVQEAIVIFNQNFDLEQGTYEAKLNAYSGKKLLASEYFEFEIDKFQIAANEAQKNDYRYGMGIYAAANDLKLTYTKNMDLNRGEKNE